MVNNIAFNVVQTPLFIEFVLAIGEHGVGYKVPSYSHLHSILIPKSRIIVDE